MEEYTFDPDRYFRSAVEVLAHTRISPGNVGELLRRVGGLSVLYGRCSEKLGVLSTCVSDFDGVNVVLDMRGYIASGIGGDCVRLTSQFISGLTHEARAWAMNPKEVLPLGAELALNNVTITKYQCYAPWFFNVESGYEHTACILGINERNILIDPSFGIACDAENMSKFGYVLLNSDTWVVDWLNQIIITEDKLALNAFSYKRGEVPRLGRCMVLGIDDELMTVYSLGFLNDVNERLLYPVIHTVAASGQGFYLFNTTTGAYTIDRGLLSGISSDPLYPGLIQKIAGMLE